MSDANDQARALKPCPFCGGEPDPTPQQTNSQLIGKKGFYVAVWCRACEFVGPEKKTVEEAIVAWNTRPPSSQPAGSEAVEATARAMAYIDHINRHDIWRTQPKPDANAAWQDVPKRQQEMWHVFAEAGLAAALSATAPADVRRGGLQPDPAELDAIVQEGVERCSVAIRRLIDNPALARTAEGDDV